MTRTCCRADVLPMPSADPYRLGRDSVETVWNGQALRQIRLQMLNGARPPQCGLCWHDEDLNGPSMRQFENQKWAERMDLEALASSTDAAGSVPHAPVYFEIRAGNLCNLKCVMCNPRNSTTWAEDSELFDGKYEWLRSKQIATKEQAAWFESPSFQKFLTENITRFEEIYFTGGEPLLLKGHYNFLQMLLDAGMGRRVRLRYDTNLTKLNPKVIGLWAQFSHVEVSVSLDGHGEVANFIRYPLDWRDLQRKMALLATIPHVHRRFGYAVGALNAEHLEIFMDWLDSSQFRDMPVWLSRVFDPDCLSLRVLNSADKSRVVEGFARIKIRWPDLADKLDEFEAYMYSEDWSDRLPQLRSYLGDLDRLRGTQSGRIFSHLSSLRS